MKSTLHDTGKTETRTRRFVGGATRHHLVAELVVPFFHLIGSDSGTRSASPGLREVADNFPGWCSAVEFCRFTRHPDSDFTPPTAA